MHGSKLAETLASIASRTAGDFDTPIFEAFYQFARDGWTIRATFANGQKVQRFIPSEELAKATVTALISLLASMEQEAENLGLDHDRRKREEQEAIEIAKAAIKRSAQALVE